MNMLLEQREIGLVTRLILLLVIDVGSRFPRNAIQKREQTNINIIIYAHG